MTFADPTSDIAFKKVFGNENKTEILISFLNAALDLQGEHEIAEIRILNPYQAPKISILKETNLDVRAITRGGVTFIVEMQVEKQDYFAKRALYYSAKAYVGQIARAEQYPKLNQVVFIGILNFRLFDSPDYLSTHLILDKKSFKQEIKDLELNFIELPKFTTPLEDLTTTIEKWIWFFKHAGELHVIPSPLTEPHEIPEAFEILAQHNWTRDEMDIYDYWAMEETGRKDALDTAKRDGRKEGFMQGMQKGMEQGRVTEKQDTARKMLKKGYALADICELTGLSCNEIESLSQE
ncbi:hypothetical protein CSB45_14740 [candidate division KSB3 bacterium]|uniref:Transposase n=1 Tax=candidate division KSB3 bacterium TaxID=2044937 RepID=A0A2G6E134_9BACT|nr:MAG: hypothetical protein CSB45_14740 [candidate division KSB3 bacterium]PIE31080.1 MAG: hypothetical protein CSA57_00255 [candidate division KSB3 bacterium]